MCGNMVWDGCEVSMVWDGCGVSMVCDGRGRVNMVWDGCGRVSMRVRALWWEGHAWGYFF